jgi:hypothetical protein
LSAAFSSALASSCCDVGQRARIVSRLRRGVASSFRILGGGAHRIGRLPHALRQALALEILRHVAGGRLRLRRRRTRVLPSGG